MLKLVIECIYNIFSQKSIDFFQNLKRIIQLKSEDRRSKDPACQDHHR